MGRKEKVDYYRLPTPKKDGVEGEYVTRLYPDENQGTIVCYVDIDGNQEAQSVLQTVALHIDLGTLLEYLDTLDEKKRKSLAKLGPLNDVAACALALIISNELAKELKIEPGGSITGMAQDLADPSKLWFWTDGVNE